MNRPLCFLLCLVIILATIGVVHFIAAIIASPAIVVGLALIVSTFGACAALYLLAKACAVL